MEEMFEPRVITPVGIRPLYLEIALVNASWRYTLGYILFKRDIFNEISDVCQDLGVNITQNGLLVS